MDSFVDVSDDSSGFADIIGVEGVTKGMTHRGVMQYQQSCDSLLGRQVC
jgi:hypothetical protein